MTTQRIFVAIASVFVTGVIWFYELRNQWAHGDTWHFNWSHSRQKQRTINILDVHATVYFFQRENYFYTLMMMVDRYISEPQGISFIETSNLDGETNLKIRQASPETARLTARTALAAFRATLQTEPPNRHLYEFNGMLKETNLKWARYPWLYWMHIFIFIFLRKPSATVKDNKYKIIENIKPITGFHV